MGIECIESKRLFHIQGRNVSYIFKADKHDNLIQLYYGKKIRKINDSIINTTKAICWGIIPEKDDIEYALDSALLEYPTFGHVDFRSGAMNVEQENGSRILDLKYDSYRIIKGKKSLKGLPATYADDKEAETIEVTLVDKLIDLHVVLSYTVFNNRNVITKSVQIINKGNEILKVLNAQSCCMDFRDSNYDMLHLSGAWARERHIVKTPLVQGNRSIGSVRGTSSHVHNPFLALMSKDATEENGEVFGFNFVYSGNFLGEVSVSETGRPRVLMGINPLNFSWQLKPEEMFQTPEVVMVYSSNGLGEMSREYHSLYRENLMRGQWKNKQRPILINNWEATYFDFTRESLEKIVKKASDIGLELFVLDDGWFGKRNDDTCSLGDWKVNTDKIEGGLEKLANNVNDMNMSFGLWFEPEMISPDSDLYRNHSDWCLHVRNRERVMTRFQLVLDLSRKEVCDYIIGSVSEVLSNAPISYVKWDMNRYLTDVMSVELPSDRQMETAHRYMLGLYYVMEEIVTRHKDVLFEGCSGGGGRFDPGILYYMPQIWTSDDSDAIERLKIQYSTSIVYPPISMGSHVSVTPNHQVGRVTPLNTRGNIAMSGNFGYELDISQYSEEQINMVKEQIDFYKENRQIIQFGDFYRLMDPYEKNNGAWMFVSEDKTEAVLFYTTILAVPNPLDQQIRCKGLDEEYNYEIDGIEGVFGGDELMNLGLTIPELKDFESVRYKIRQVNN
ncbi:alpha-galactosidase [Vallitalea longa]|uniref:Alpha-galactosidase n=1 Tax=Vallitalea longa TaxID=2936439 RepID=A0A9W6DHJ1_9FIRM|nr:alpha-galactosidase [Vallitalea longa]GKX31622.1 alpha-galactosidase [Vallitalea longa]